MSFDRLTTPIGEVMFTQRSVRKFKPDAIPAEDIRLILEAAVKAPNGANRQIARFLVVNDRDKIRAFGALYHEAWWAKRRDERGWTKPADIPPEETSYRAAMSLADEFAANAGAVGCHVHRGAAPAIEGAGVSTALYGLADTGSVVLAASPEEPSASAPSRLPCMPR